MKVTYLKHSGFLLEWEHCCWLIDYYKGKIPDMDPQKQIYVFCSHSHQDHFNPMIFTLAQKYPNVKYIFSNQIKNSYKKFLRTAAGKQIPQDICIIDYLLSRETYEYTDPAGQSMKIETLQSTDEGCAFLITYEGKTIYHAGDLHWWYWEEERDEWNSNMTAMYKKEMEYLEGREIDLAFTPLDPRLKKEYAWGMNYLLDKAKIKHVFPMHFWDQFDIIDKYLKTHKVPAGTQFHKLMQDGQNEDLSL